jgi:G:T-mismatch repair DNA endonuclease (very short patch repair protein)
MSLIDLALILGISIAVFAFIVWFFFVWIPRNELRRTYMSMPDCPVCNTKQFTYYTRGHFWYCEKCESIGREENGKIVWREHPLRKNLMRDGARR